MAQTIYSPALKAHLSIDDGDEERRIRNVRHSQEYRLSDENIPRFAAREYLFQLAPSLEISTEHLQNLDQRAQALWPDDRGIEYRLDDEKRLFDSVTVSYSQTYMNLPVWRKGVSVTVKQAPNRIANATSNVEQDLQGELPDEATLDRYRSLFENAGRTEARPRPQGESEVARGDETAAFVRRALKVSTRAAAKQDDRARLLNGRFVVYKYAADKRFAGRPTPPDPKDEMSLESSDPPFPKLPRVAEEIQEGRAYVVAELIFRYDMPDHGEMVWLALQEVETGSILYIEPMTQGVKGRIFRTDPQVSGCGADAADDNATLSLCASLEELNALDAPSGGTQNLRGTYVVIQNEENPNIATPTESSGADFDYQPRTNDYGAVSAYYHETELFRRIEDLGFTIATYFDGTTFPIPVDHRGMGTADANTINAHWSPNGTGGTDHMCYALCDTTDTDDPLARAVDPWVHWHEMGGHGTLGDHVGSGTLGFAHSAGDGLAAIQFDPESALRGTADRFRYAPFRPFGGSTGITERRFDRDPATWGWGSANDNGGYGSEQILATCHFRIYRSLGGDHTDLGRRLFASRAATYLILRSIGTLTPGTNPTSAQEWCEVLQATDLLNWTSEGLAGGAYNKVIRWAFEEQGAYGSQPPAVDVYIDDGRAGEYQFQSVHWQCMSMWNRNLPDGLPGHQNAIEGVTNYFYVKVKNRGTSAASNVTVKGYHSLPGAGLTWPNDFTAMSPAAGKNVASIAANNGEEVTVGPFEWVPNVNAYGHDCALMIVSTDGDPSNIDNFSGTETIAEWRLVPHDNNIGQRNVNIVPGGSGLDGLLSGLDQVIFFAGNPFNRPALMQLQAEIPAVLARKGWGMEFSTGTEFRLAPGEKQQVEVKLVKGSDFTADEIRGSVDRNINVYVRGNDMMLGGMTYQVDPDLKERSGGKQDHDVECVAAAQHLLDCMCVPDAHKVRDARVTRVSIDFDFEGLNCD